MYVNPFGDKIDPLSLFVNSFLKAPLGLPQQVFL